MPRAGRRCGGLCATCWGKLSFIAPPYCERLGTPFAYDPGPGMFRQAIADPPAYRRARAAVRYDESPARWCTPSNMATASTSPPAWAAGWRAPGGTAEEADALVPVPLHWRRLWARRFNQAAMLAKAISAETGVPVAHDASGASSDPQQVGLTQAERAHNVQGAFACRPAARQGCAAGASCWLTMC